MKSKKNAGTQTFLWLLSLLVVASMICGLVAALQPPRARPAPAPTSRNVISEPTAAPAQTSTPTPTSPPPTAEPPAAPPPPTLGPTTAPSPEPTATTP